MMENPTHAYSEVGSFEVFHTPTIGGEAQSRASAGTVHVWPRLSDYATGASGGFEETVEGEGSQTRKWVDLETGLMGAGNPVTLFPPGTSESKLGRSDLAFSFIPECRKQANAWGDASSSWRTARIRTYLGNYVGDGHVSDYLSWVQCDWESKCVLYPSLSGYPYATGSIEFHGQHTLTVNFYGTSKVVFTESFSFTKDASEIPQYANGPLALAGAKANAGASGLGCAKYYDSGWVYMGMCTWDIPGSDWASIEIEVRKGWSRNETTGKLINSGTSVWINGEWWMNLSTMPKIGADHFPMEGYPGTGWIYMWDEYYKYLSGEVPGEGSLLTIAIPEFKYYGDPISHLWFPSS